MSSTQPIEGLPPVLMLPELAAVLRTSITTIRRQLRHGTFPIRPMSGPRMKTGLDSRYRWARVDVDAYLSGGFRAFDTGAVRLRPARKTA